MIIKMHKLLILALCFTANVLAETAEEAKTKGEIPKVESL